MIFVDFNYYDLISEVRETNTLIEEQNNKLDEFSIKLDGCFNFLVIISLIVLIISLSPVFDSIGGGHR